MSIPAGTNDFLWKNLDAKMRLQRQGTLLDPTSHTKQVCYGVKSFAPK